MDSCIFPVKIFRPIEGKLELVRIYTVDELGRRSDAIIKKLYIHPSEARLTKKDREGKKKNV